METDKRTPTNYIKRLFLIAFILVSCIGCDQLTKAAAKSYLMRMHAISYLGDFFRLQYMENTGAFLSLGATLPPGFRFWTLTILTGIVTVGLFVFILVRRNLRLAFVVAGSLIVAGGAGNLIDRLFNNGVVVDFMNIGMGRLRTGIFNIADVAIMIGEGMLIFLLAQRAGVLKPRS